LSRRYAGDIYLYCKRIVFLGGGFFGGIFPPSESPSCTVTELREQGSTVTTEQKGERASKRSQENGRERGHNKFYFLTLRKKCALKTPRQPLVTTYDWTESPLHPEHPTSNHTPIHMACCLFVFLQSGTHSFDTLGIRSY